MEPRISHAHSPLPSGVPSTPARLSADDRHAGRGVVMAFLDSGFFPHPDLTSPENRIVAFHALEAPGRALDPERDPDDSDWHGTQTSVVAAGSGFLSGGVYRGLAPEARLVLVKVGRGGRIGDADLARALEWILAHHERYGIRVVNVSLGADRDAPLSENRVNRLAEEVVSRGIVLVAAAGNSGCTDRPHSLPPATAPSAITAGGYDDSGDPSLSRLSLYCSSFGPTADGLSKPELIALASGVAAPILPRTAAYRRAVALSRLMAAPDAILPALLEDLREEGVDLPALAGSPADGVRRWARETASREKLVAAHYQRVDGTSFAAPIVSAVVAQMLEANPALTPAAVKHLLARTAGRIPGLPVERQGSGVLDARRAVEAALWERHGGSATAFGGPRIAGRSLLFSYHDDAAARVSVVGDFNGWNPGRAPLARDSDGVWRAEVPLPPPGRYRYKLFVDESRWVEDPDNGARVPDPYGAFDSVIEIPA
ncbi:MAG: S8 family serine peptidase [Acidobacteriota bacterium]